QDRVPPRATGTRAGRGRPPRIGLSTAPATSFLSHRGSTAPACLCSYTSPKESNKNPARVERDLHHSTVWHKRSSLTAIGHYMHKLRLFSVLLLASWPRLARAEV